MYNVEQLGEEIQSCDSDVLKWIQEKYKYSKLIQCNKILNILYFPLLWNIFERECFDTDAKISKVDQFIESGLHDKRIDINITILDEVWRFYRERYINGSKPTESFSNNLFYGDTVYQGKALEILMNHNPPLLDKLKALLLIFFRLRNNIMHGNKNISILYEQDTLFKHANSLLMDILKDVTLKFSDN